MSNSAPTYQKLTQKLAHYRRKNARLYALTSLLNFIFAAIVLLLLLVVFESVGRFSSPGRMIILGAAAAAFVIVSVMTLMRPTVFLIQYLREPLFKTAIFIGQALDSVNDRLANALQIYENFERDKRRYSVPLIEASLQKAASEVESADFGQLLDYTAVNRATVRAAVISIIFLAAGLGFFAPFSAAAFRLAHPARDFSRESNLTFFVQPGEKTVLKGESVHLAVVLSDSTFNTVDLYLHGDAHAQEISLEKTEGDSFTHTIKNVRQDFKYHFAVGKRATQEFRIHVVERPMLRTLQLKIEPPGYTNLAPYFLDENVGDVSVLKGSTVMLNGTANKRLAAALIDYVKAPDLKMSVKERRLAARFRVFTDDDYIIRLYDMAGNENISPIEYKIRILADNYPIVQILSPGQDIDLGDDMIIPLLIEAQDDFGVSRLRLAYQLLPGGQGELDSTQFRFSDIQGFEENSEQIRIAIKWALTDVDMYPTDVIAYYVEAFDNDNVSGPKSSRTAIFHARFPSLYEMYQETAEEQADATDTFEQALERSRELEEKLHEMALEMKRSTEMDWQKKQQIEEAVNRQKEIEEQLESAMQQLDEMIEKIEKNNLFTQETMQKLEEIQNLYKQIMTPELQDVMQKMNEALQNLDEKLLREAMEKFKLNMEDYNKTLDRTISLLKKLRAEQQLDQALKMAQDLEKRQSQISEQAEGQNTENQRLAKEQEQIARDTDKLAEVLEQLQQEMRDIPASPMEQVEQAAEQMQQDNLQENLSELQQNMANDKMSGVPQQSTAAQKSFQKMAQHLQTAQQMMSGEMQRQAMNAMRKSSRELLQLSKQQESLLQQLQTLTPNSLQNMDIAEQQQQTASSLQRVVDGMAETMKNNFGIDPQIAKELGKAAQEMESALSALGERNKKMALQSQGQSMAHMNAAVRGMQQAMQNMMQQGGSGGMSYQQFLQQMQQMADQQGQLNQRTQAMGNPGQLTPGQQAAMTRLAAEQGQLRKSMQQLAKEAGGMSEILGSLEHIAEDMKKVEEDFANKKITRDTIQRQNRILSRMLDAQKSMNKREFSHERQAETGKSYLSKSPDDLPKDFGERENQLQQDLLRAKKEGYSRDYLRLIETYFKALTEHEMAE